MRKIIMCMCSALLCSACLQKATVFETFEHRTPEERWAIMQEYYIVPGAPVSDERPLLNVLSEQEVLLKAADYAIAKGVLDPSYYAYQNNPALMTAKIEAPSAMI